MKLITTVLLFLLFTGPIFGEAKKLSSSDHIAVLITAVQSLQAQVIALRRRLNEVVNANENLRFSFATAAQENSYVSSVRQALENSGADPERCRMESLLSSKIVCSPDD